MVYYATLSGIIDNIIILDFSQPKLPPSQPIAQWDISVSLVDSPGVDENSRAMS